MQRNMAAAREAATAVGNQDSGSTPAPAKGSGPGTDQVSDFRVLCSVKDHKDCRHTLV